MPNSAALVRALGAAFCAILCALSGMGGGGMMIGARTAAWAKSGGPVPPSLYGGLCFTAVTSNSSVQLTAVGSVPSVTLVKSFDGVNWSNYTVGDVIELPSVGDFVYLAAGEGGNDTFGSSMDVYHKFVIYGLVAAHGDITSLRRFDLEQTALASNCYNSLFRDCTGLVSAPELPATALATNCCRSMFQGCTGLVSAPELPATTLANSCYNLMFQGCTGLVSAPELHATKLVLSCYRSMFQGCTGLTSIKVHFTTWGAQTTVWAQDVSASGTFYKPSALAESYGDSKIPTGWTVVNID